MRVGDRIRQRHCSYMENAVRCKHGFLLTEVDTYLITQRISPPRILIRHTDPPESDTRDTSPSRHRHQDFIKPSLTTMPNVYDDPRGMASYKDLMPVAYRMSEGNTNLCRLHTRVLSYNAVWMWWWASCA